MITKQIIVSGKVQGVGFRNYTQKMARRHKIIGWARNLDTGEVEIWAQSDNPSSFELFLKYISRGPERAEVINVHMKDLESVQIEGDNFVIRPDGVLNDS